MIYLEHERETFEETKKKFLEAYRSALERMWQVFVEKGKVRDNTPLHHRQSPSSQLGIAQAKCRRLDALLASPFWSQDVDTLSKIIEECGDAANYLIFIAALCSMLQEELV